MSYFPQTDPLYNEFKNWLSLLKERGGDPGPYESLVQELLVPLTTRLQTEVDRAPVMKDEPSELPSIRALRPRGPRRLELTPTDAALEDKLLGAWLGRAAGCILGIPCEGMSKPDIRSAAKALGMKYPLRDYWQFDPQLRAPDSPHYGLTPRRRFLRDHLHSVGTDDDLTYTLLGLLILEEHGPGFTTADVAAAWLKYLPVACTAEKVALDNLRHGVPPAECGALNNPFVDWIGADIRSDPWGYAAPGWPEKAAEFAWRDAWISHRATGIHGEMFFSAAIAAAFAVADPIEAVEAGLTEIPRKCRTAKVVKETLRWCRRDHDWDTTTDRILAKYEGMGNAHTLHNAGLTVAGLYYGRGDFAKTITFTVMGGVDTDCTGATAGSLVGAILGARRLPKKWVAPLGTRAESYLLGRRRWQHRDIAARFARVARRVLAEEPT